MSFNQTLKCAILNLSNTLNQLFNFTKIVTKRYAKFVKSFCEVPLITSVFFFKNELETAEHEALNLSQDNMVSNEKVSVVTKTWSELKRTKTNKKQPKTT